MSIFEEKQYLHMKTLALTLCSLCLCGVILQADLTEILSFGAPPSSTGAPGEITCAESGCHDDGPIPMKHDAHLMNIQTPSGAFIPGDTALITINVKDADIHRFGFQMTAIDENGQSLGEFLITDPNHTQIMQNHVDLRDRQYVTYTKAGTQAQKVGEHEWSFKWIIPNTNARFAHFFLATVSANNDNRDKGDRVFLRDTVIPIKSMTSVHEETKVLFERKGDILTVNQDGNPFSIAMYSMLGYLYTEYQGNTVSIDLNSIPKGLYILKAGNSIYPFIP